MFAGAEMLPTEVVICTAKRKAAVRVKRSEISEIYIRLVVKLYIRFPLLLRNVEDLLHEHGIDVSHGTVRYWLNRFGAVFDS